LYADLGHFGAASIRISWLFVVLPALIINYLGQGALLISDPTLYQTPFFSSIPLAVYWPMFVLATLATIIASQAMITGCFSLVSQAISLGFFPPVTVRHTSKNIIGQIYIPEVNYFLMILTVLVIVGFGQSSSITQAYGFTVCSVMCLTTVLYTMVMRYTWNYPWWKISPFFFFLIVDSFFLASNAAKIPNGGWVSVMFGFFFSCIMLIWYYGEKELKKSVSLALQNFNIQALKKNLKEELGVEENEEGQEDISGANIKSINFKSITMREGENGDDDDDDAQTAGSSSSSESVDPKGRESSVIDMASSVLPKGVKRIPGMGVFLSPNKRHIPTVFQVFVNYVNAVPETIVFLTLEHVSIPFVPSEFKTEVTKYGSGIYRVLGRFGYAENKIKIEEVIVDAFKNGLEKPDKYTIFVNTEHVRVVTKNYFFRFVLWLYGLEKKFFIGTMGNFQLPKNNVMAVGMQVDL